ncbi:MAG: hypothetical protein ABIY55_05345 [Kofleriaceae bacterium]
MAKQHEQSAGLWLKLAADKDRAVVVFLGEPFPRDVCFVDGKYVLFDDKLKAQGERPSMRVAFNVALYDTKEVKVLEQGLMFFKDLVRIRNKYGLDKWAFEIQRHGAANDPKTTYSILPEHALSPDDLAQFQALERHDLAAVYAAEAPRDELDSYDRKAAGDARRTAKAREASGSNARTSSASSAVGVATGAVIDDRVVQILVTHLKALPREAVDRFLKTFGVTRIKDVPAAQAAKALALLDALVLEYDPPSAPAVSADPFE